MIVDTNMNAIPVIEAHCPLIAASTPVAPPSDMTYTNFKGHITLTRTRPPSFGAGKSHAKS